MFKRQPHHHTKSQAAEIQSIEYMLVYVQSTQENLQQAATCMQHTAVEHIITCIFEGK